MARRTFGSEAYVYALLIQNAIRYIGKGRRDRAARHLADARRNLDQLSLCDMPATSRLQRGLCRALKDGHSVSILVLRSGLSDEEAWGLERTLIAAFGRKKIDPAGTLWNLSAGGDGQTSEHAIFVAEMRRERGTDRTGSVGKRHTEQSRRRISEGVRKTFAETDAMSKAISKRVGRKASIEHSKNISIALTGKPKSAEHRLKLAASKIGHVRTKESRERQGQALTAYCATEAGRAHMRKASAAAHARRAQMRAEACLSQSKSTETI